MIHSAKREYAVSPVIGTILLVAITVVLIAIIAAVVMGLSGSAGNNKQVGLTVEPVIIPAGNAPYYDNMGALTITIFGGKDVSRLRGINVSLEGAEFVTFRGNSNMDMNNSEIVLNYAMNPEVASSDLVGFPLYYVPFPIPIDESGLASARPGTNKSEFKIYYNAKIVVTGIFSDGTEQVIYTTNKISIPTSERAYITSGTDAWRNRPQSPVII